MFSKLKKQLELGIGAGMGLFASRWVWNLGPRYYYAA
jgi:hypothetical protein